jgi:pyruvate dehydrogenase E1 component alpha subunit
VSSSQLRRNVDLARLKQQHRDMLRIRAFEEAALAAAEDGLVKGAIHPSIGQEAVAVGVCGNLARADYLLSTHRGHGQTLIKGADATAMMCELFGREGGTCGGKGGSMHIADFDAGMLGANGVVGANIEIAAGAAHAVKLRGEDRVVACIFGDGAINRGPFLEGLNWARIFDLAVLFVCEDNGFAATTRTRDLTGGPGPAARAESLGIPASEVDGNDVVAVDAAVRDKLALIRGKGGGKGGGGGGPQFLVCRTYRLSGHTHADAATYRGADEVAAARQDDPIRRSRAWLEEAGMAAAELDALAAEAGAEMAAVSAAAAAAPWPALEAAYRDIQDIGAPREAVP